MPLELLEGGYTYDLPDVIERDGKRYRKRQISAYAIKPGDLTDFWDCTGPVGTPAGYAVGEIHEVRKFSARECPAPWRRVELHVRNWDGTMRSWNYPAGPLEYAPRTRVRVWRSDNKHGKEDADG